MADDKVDCIWTIEDQIGATKAFDKIPTLTAVKMSGNFTGGLTGFQLLFSGNVKSPILQAPLAQEPKFQKYQIDKRAHISKLRVRVNNSS